MPTQLETYTDKLELPFMLELGKDMILDALQDQVQSPIDPASLAFDREGFVWEDGDIVLDVTFRDRKGFGQGRVVVQPCLTADLDVCFTADIKFTRYLPSAGSS
jgi:hypothetical protein